MRLLANENIPLAAVRSLQEYGYDVLWIRENAPGSADDEHLAQFIVNVMASRSDWSDQFSVVEVDRIRMKPL